MLGFKEWSAALTLNQLLAGQWSAGMSYRFISSELRDQLPAIPPPDALAGNFTHSDDTTRSDLHQIGTYALYNHPRGFFARAEANWYAQDNILRTYDPSGARIQSDQPSDNFAQFNLFVGWRFRRQRGDVTFGVLNLAGGDYHLNPLNSYPELPHERVFTAQLRLRF
jgi:hypothetical protein